MKSFLLTLGIVAFVVAVIALGSPSPKPATAAAPTVPTVVPRWISEDVIVTTKASRVGSLKSVVDFRFTIENKYDYAIKDVRIKCRWFGASGSEIGDTDVVVYENFPARRKRTAAELTLSVHSQSVSSRCEAAAYRRS